MQETEAQKSSKSLEQINGHRQKGKQDSTGPENVPRTPENWNLGGFRPLGELLGRRGRCSWGWAGCWRRRGKEAPGRERGGVGVAVACMGALGRRGSGLGNWLFVIIVCCKEHMLHKITHNKKRCAASLIKVTHSEYQTSTRRVKKCSEQNCVAWASYPPILRMYPGGQKPLPHRSTGALKVEDGARRRGDSHSVFRTPENRKIPKKFLG